MVGSLSSISLVSTLSTSRTDTSSGAQKASLESQIEAKQTELDEAKTEEDKQAINDEIAELQARLKAVEAAEARKTDAQQQQAAPEKSGQTEASTLIGTRNFTDEEQFGNRQIWV